MASAANASASESESESDKCYYKKVASTTTVAIDDSDSDSDSECDSFDLKLKDSEIEEFNLTRPLSTSYFDELEFNGIDNHSFFNLSDSKKTFQRLEAIRFYHDLKAIKQNLKFMPKRTQLVLHIGGYSYEAKYPINGIQYIRSYVLLILPSNEDCSKLIEHMKEIHDVCELRIYRCLFPTLHQQSQLKSFSGCVRTDFYKSKNKLIKAEPTKEDITFCNSIKDLIIEIAKSDIYFIIFNDAMLSIQKKISIINDFFSVICDIFAELKKINRKGLILLEPVYYGTTLNALILYKYGKFKIKIFDETAIPLFNTPYNRAELYFTNKYGKEIKGIIDGYKFRLYR